MAERKKPVGDEGSEEMMKLAGLDGLIKAEVSKIEDSLAGKLDQVVANIYNKVAEDMRVADEARATKIEAAIAALPNMIQGQIENQIQANITAISNQVSAQFEGKIKEMAGGGNSSGAIGLGSFLNRATPTDIVNVINAWKQPSSDQQLASVFRTFIEGMRFGSRIKSGQVTAQDMEDALSFTTPTQK